MRLLCILALVLLATGCPSYDRYSRLADEEGLLPADEFARFGAEQAQAIAIGRAFGASYTGPGLAASGRQVAQAVAYARTLPDVVEVAGDSSARLITVRFRSGWRKAILPISDGVPPDRTPGLPPRR